MKLIVRILMNALAIWVSSELIPGFIFSGSVVDLIIVGIVFGLVNAIIRPVVKLLSLPITLLTLGLFTLVINTLMLLLTVWLLDPLSLDGAQIQQIITAFLAAIVISIVSTILSWFLPNDKE